jgi:hypothetical protein
MRCLRGLHLLACLLLAIITFQAVPSGPLPLWLDDGPAFSAQSAAVALPGPRERVGQTVALPDNPPAPPLPETLGPVPLAIEPLVILFPTDPLLARPPPNSWQHSAARPRSPPTVS